MRVGAIDLVREIAAPRHSNTHAPSAATPENVAMKETLKDLIDRFIGRPPEGNSPEDIKARLLKWRDVYSTPEKFTTDTHPQALKAARRNARQNIRRLALRHPELAAQLMQEGE
jgi:hypothetical protein